MTLPQQPDTTRIHRLIVRGPSGTRQRLLPKLEASHWPAPTDGSWVLVRQVAASAGKSRLASELVEKARQQINSGDPSEVVRFASLAALVAALITDLSRGIASQRWYWQRWSRFWPLPAGDAIQQVMQEHPRELVSVCHLLASEGNLIDVWQRLSAENSSAVLSALCHELGLTHHTRGSATADPKTDSPGMVIPSRQVRRWQPIFATLPDTDPRSTLAALVIATESATVALLAEPATTLASIRERMKHSGEPPQPSHSVLTLNGTGSHAGDRLHTPGPQQSSGATDSHAASQDNEPGPQTTSESPAIRIGTNTPAIPELSGAGGGLTAPDADTEALSAAYDLPQNQSLAIRSDRVRTDMGGALYLLNILNRPPIQAIMEQAWQTLPSGWAWLYRLARELDLDQEDPLCAFLAERLGLESVAELESLPQLPQRQAVLSLAGQWFSWEDLWSPTLIRVPAELAYTPGHLDLYLDNSQVRLELRLAGLDLNPGWLPWLGTVVTFHFDHFPHLQRATS
ncbi:hypothetical protein [Marinobacter orientalis]|uniref:Uncharacterized protein n=1 Tax=Marinobacter orientalis TaxID=1928859 RepID=A0A7Y0REZ2_9GAMM|nr:hypothetical protein [Marinobacter orientalis]NMT64983.1 hypothetical protein [Marinobacter orientalis]TGX48125.1 hypothetical protein DIT72_16015 [Marinobacter orientalis]